MDYTKLFYWLTVADNARTLFITMTIIFTAICVIATIANIACAADGEEEGRRIARKWMWKSYPFMLIFWLLVIFTPSKRDALLIVAGGQTLNFLVSDESAKQIPTEMSSFVLTELKNMAKDAEIDLNIKQEKQKVLDEVKELSSEELLKRLKTDEQLKDLLLGN